MHGGVGGGKAAMSSSILFGSMASYAIYEVRGLTYE
jgi:hypothetical protein